MHVILGFGVLCTVFHQYSQISFMRHLALLPPLVLLQKKPLQSFFTPRYLPELAPRLAMRLKAVHEPAGTTLYCQYEPLIPKEGALFEARIEFEQGLPAITAVNLFIAAFNLHLLLRVETCCMVRRCTRFFLQSVSNEIYRLPQRADWMV
jgi:hypothetical protein